MQKWSLWKIITFHPKILMFVALLVIILLERCSEPLGRSLHVSPFLLIFPLAFCLAWAVYVVVALWNFGVIHEASEKTLFIKYTALRLMDLYMARHDWSNLYFITANRQGCWLVGDGKAHFISSELKDYQEMLGYIRSFCRNDISLYPITLRENSNAAKLSGAVLNRVRVGLAAGLTTQVTAMLRDDRSISTATAAEIIAEVEASERQAEQERKNASDGAPGGKE